MVAVLEIFDEQRPGSPRELRHRIEMPIDRIAARDLGRCAEND